MTCVSCFKTKQYYPMPRIPAATVPFVRAFLQQLGIAEDVVADNGEVDGKRFIGEVVNEVELQSAVMPPQIISLRQDAAAPKPDGGGGGGKTKPAGAGAGQRIGRLVKPVVTVRGIFGERVLAPFGRPKPNAWKYNAIGTGVALSALFAGVLAVGYMAGAARTRRLARGAAPASLPPRAVGAPLGALAAPAAAAA